MVIGKAAMPCEVQPRLPSGSKDETPALRSPKNAKNGGQSPAVYPIGHLITTSIWLAPGSATVELRRLLAEFHMLFVAVFVCLSDAREYNRGRWGLSSRSTSARSRMTRRLTIEAHPAHILAASHPEGI